ncbi:hypothetical protein ACNKW8_004542 [Salmonella enterica]
MRNANEGVSLAAIVAKETTTGEWSGAGGGIGLGTGSTGLFIGIMGGEKLEQTQRAKEFEAPEEKKNNPINIYKPMIIILAFGVLFSLVPKFISALSPFPSEDENLLSNSGTISVMANAQSTLTDAVDLLSYLIPCLAIFFAVIWLIFFSDEKRKEELKRAEQEKIRIKARKEIYHRLRYIENEHIVFDPVTGREVPAERTCINELIEALADGKNNDS